MGLGCNELELEKHTATICCSVGLQHQLLSLVSSWHVWRLWGGGQMDSQAGPLQPNLMIQTCLTSWRVFLWEQLGPTSSECHSDVSFCHFPVIFLPASPKWNDKWNNKSLIWLKLHCLLVMDVSVDGCAALKQSNAAFLWIYIELDVHS